jgi:aspartate racemase
MKVIGLLGGMSWESSAVYYDILNREVKNRLGGHHSCECIMYSVDFSMIEELMRKGDWDTISGILVESARRLERGGAELLVLCTNTMHRLAPAIESGIGIPLIHIVDAVAARIGEKNISKVALLGTRYTMEQEFYKGRLTAKHGIQVIIPDLTGVEAVHRIIFDELVHGIIRKESLGEYLGIIEKLVERGAQGIVLGCTEIPLLVKQTDVAVPLFDTTAIHAETAIQLALDA